MLIDKLNQVAPLIRSLQGIKYIPKFESKIDFPGVVVYGKEHVFNFETKQSADTFASSMNTKIDELLQLEKQNIENLAKDILEDKGTITPL